MPTTSATFGATQNGRTITANVIDGAIYLEVSHAQTRVRTSAPLSLMTEAGDLLRGLSVVAAREREVHESYELAVGKRIGAHEVTHTEHAIDLRNDAGQVFTLILRAANDGVAFRWVLPALGDSVQVLGADACFEVSSAAACWPLKYTPWYEEPRTVSTVGQLPVTQEGYGLPLLVELDAQDGTFVLLAEADLDGRYGGSRLLKQDNAASSSTSASSTSTSRSTATSTLAYALADPVQLSSEPVSAPWRVFFLGTLPEIVESHLVEDLAAPARGGIPEWVRPGRSAWSWWSDFYSGAQLDVQKRLVDFAAEHGWDHVLVDCGWDRAWLPELVAYASARGIGIFVWVSWDWLKVDTELAEWAAWGVAGIKPDFMESESQERYRWYDSVIAECARVGLMVNFHGSVIPRGWARTYPHVISYEAVRGAEYYVFYNDPFDAPVHNTIVPFTRNVVGSADYTPVTFSAKSRTSSEAHELALSVVLESGMTNFADDIAQYQRRPLAQLVLDSIVAAWDETRLLGGRPGEWVALARRHGEHWFVGVISAGAARSVTFPVPAEQFTLVTDAPASQQELDNSADDNSADDNSANSTGTLVSTTITAVAGQVTLNLAANGGATLVPPHAAALHHTPQVLAAPRLASALEVGEPGQIVTVTVTEPANALGTLVITGPKGWDIKPESSGWSITVPAQARPGSVATFGVRVSDAAKRTPLTHFRIAVAPSVGVTSLVEAHPIAASNQFGPVERNQTNGGGDPFDGQPMTIGGTVYDRGLGVSSPSHLRFAVGGIAQRLTGSVGIDCETPATRATARVVGDGVVLASFELEANLEPQELDLDITGVHLLDLETVATSTDPAHVDWINPQIVRSLHGHTS